VQCLRINEIAFLFRQSREIIQNSCDKRVRRTDRLLLNSQCAFVEQPGAKQVSFSLSHARKVVETHCDTWILGPKRFLLYRQRPLGERLSTIGFGEAATAEAFVPLSFAPGEAYQFD
jgi:hypothetical protein